MINITIQGNDVPVLVDTEEPFSVVTTGFLKNLDLNYHNVELNNKLILLCGKVLESVGMFKETFILGNASFEYSVRIIHADLPFLLLGRDWFDDHNARYSKSKRHLYFTSQQKRLRIPLMDLLDEEKESNEETLYSLCSSQNKSMFQKMILGVAIDGGCCNGVKVC